MTRDHWRSGTPHASRKRTSLWSCHVGGAGLPCPPRRRGNPAAARAKRRGEARVAPRPWSGTRSHRETEGTGDVRKAGRGSFGIVERSPDGGSHDPQILPGDGRARSSDRNPAGGFGHRQELRSELGPRPDFEWTRVPRGLRLRPRLPRDFLVFRGDLRSSALRADHPCPHILLASALQPATRPGETFTLPFR
jgi:hypothetical protein